MMAVFSSDAEGFWSLRSLFLFFLRLGSFALAAFAIRVLLTRTKTVFWQVPVAPANDDGAQVALDAAEKGDTAKSRRALAAPIPFDLEKRAILHKRWMMVAHDSQFKKPGDYRSYTAADVPFFVIRDKDGKLRAFHNVCRHRAYAVVRKPCGNAPRLACKYHGWQYETTGALVKAPQFMDVDKDQQQQLGGLVFDPAANGLFEIHLRIDSGRFVFVNFATQQLDAFPWSDTSTTALRTLNFGDPAVVEWTTEVDVGWRIASLLPWFIDPAAFVARSWNDKVFSYLPPTRWPELQYVDDGSFICNFGNGSFLLVSALPADGSNKTLVQCTYLPAANGNGKETSTTSTSPSSPNSTRLLVDAQIRSAVSKLKKLRGADNTKLDFRQSAVRERLDKFARHVDQHRRMEKVAGRKISPSTRVTGHDAIDVEAEAICSALEGLGGVAADNFEW